MGNKGTRIVRPEYREAIRSLQQIAGLRKQPGLQRAQRRPLQRAGGDRARDTAQNAGIGDHTYVRGGKSRTLPQRSRNYFPLLESNDHRKRKDIIENRALPEAPQKAQSAR